jgi:hypothetical protein
MDGRVAPAPNTAEIRTLDMRCVWVVWCSNPSLHRFAARLVQTCQCQSINLIPHFCPCGPPNADEDGCCNRRVGHCLDYCECNVALVSLVLLVAFLFSLLCCQNVRWLFSMPVSDFQVQCSYEYGVQCQVSQCFSVKFRSVSVFPNEFADSLK